MSKVASFGKKPKTLRSHFRTSFDQLFRKIKLNFRAKIQRSILGVNIQIFLNITFNLNFHGKNSICSWYLFFFWRENSKIWSWWNSFFCAKIKFYLFRIFSLDQFLDFFSGIFNFSNFSNFQFFEFPIFMNFQFIHIDQITINLSNFYHFVSYVWLKYSILFLFQFQ